MSKTKAKPEVFKAKFADVEVSYTLVSANGYRAKFVYQGETILTRWRVTKSPVLNDVAKIIWQRLELESQH